MEELKKTAKEALEALKKEGADRAKCDVGESVTHEFNVDGGNFSLFRTLFDRHLILTAIKDGKKGTVRQNRYDAETVKEAAKSCLETAASAQADEAWDIAPLTENRDFEDGVPTPDLDRLFFRCKELMEDIGKRFPKVLMEQMIVSHTEEKSVHANTNGVLFSRRQGEYRVSLMFSAHEGEKTSSFFGSDFVTDSLEKPFLSCGSVKKDLSDAEKQIETVGVNGKFEGVMILTPSCLTEFLYYTLENFAGEGALLSGTSPWKGKIGEKVASEELTLSVNPFDPRIVGGERVTSDGFPAENYDLIRDGVLLNFMASLYGEKKLGVKRAPNSSGNFVLRPGDKSLEELIASVEKGILVGRFSGGEPSSNGDFSGVAKNSFLIEKGKLAGALSETMISGNLADMLKRISGISDTPVVNGDTALPYVAFEGITVSGK